MKTIATLLAGLLLCASTPMLAQNLTKTEGGQIAVGQCYATCSDRSFKSGLALINQLNYVTSMVISEDFEIQATSAQDELFLGQQRLVCSLMQAHVGGMDACLAGCTDIETAYGVKSSNARSRFHLAFREERKILVDTGLWIDYKTPVLGASFNRACDNFWNTAAQGDSKPDKLLLIQTVERRLSQ